MRRILSTMALVMLFGCSDELPALPDSGTPLDQGQTDGQVTPLDGPMVVLDGPAPVDVGPEPDWGVIPFDVGPAPDAGCPDGECYTGTECAELMEVPCETNPNLPANASDISGTIMAVCDPNGSGQWIVPPSFCAWQCDPNFCELNGQCLKETSVPCDAAGSPPANAHFVQGQVTVQCLASGGFASPDACNIACDAGFERDANPDRCVVDPDRAIVIFSAGGFTDGLGGRTGANLLCAKAADGSSFTFSSRSSVAALISVVAHDAIRDLPRNYGVPDDQPVVSMKSIMIAESFPKLLSGTILETLKSAGVSDAEFWYSGSTPDGGVTTNTCGGWTDGPTISTRADYGRTDLRDERWIQQSGTAVCRSSQYDLLCLAYVPVP